MADLEKTLAIIFTAQNDLGQTLDGIGQQLASAIPQVRDISVTATADAAAISQVQDKITVALPDLRDISVTATADGSTIEKAYGVIIQRFPDGQTLLTNVGVKADAANLTAVKKKIDDAIPSAKVMDIQAKIDVAKIKADADIINHAIEWKAKIDIAQVEAETARLKTMFESINNTVTSTGQTLTGLFGALNQSQGKGTSSTIEAEIRAESARRNAALELQKKLIEAEVDVLKARAEAVKKGDSIIKIESSNLAPHLEAFMLEILKAIQVKANAEGMKFLVGV